MNAPSGPRNPQIFTDASCVTASCPNVAVNIMYAHAIPTSTPVIWIMMCAGVQNVSRPIDMCHEISHGPPIIPLATPATMHQIVHGTLSTRARAPTRADIGGLAICCPKGIDCPIVLNSSTATTSGFLRPCRESTPRHPFCKPPDSPSASPTTSKLRTANHFVSLPSSYMEHSLTL